MFSWIVAVALTWTETGRAGSASAEFLETLDSCELLKPGLVTRDGEHVGFDQVDRCLYFNRFDQAKRKIAWHTVDPLSKPAADRIGVEAATSRILERENGDYVFVSMNCVGQLSKSGELRWFHDFNLSNSNDRPLLFTDGSDIVVFVTPRLGSIEQLVYDEAGNERRRSTLHWTERDRECEGAPVDAEWLSRGRFALASVCRNGLRVGIVENGVLVKTTFRSYVRQQASEVDCSWICSAISTEDHWALFVRRVNGGVFVLSSGMLHRFDEDLKVLGEARVDAVYDHEGAASRSWRFADLLVTADERVFALVQDAEERGGQGALLAGQFTSLGQFVPSDWRIPFDDSFLTYRSLREVDGKPMLAVIGKTCAAQLSLESGSNESRARVATTLLRPQIDPTRKCACPVNLPPSKTPSDSWYSELHLGGSIGMQFGALPLNGTTSSLYGLDLAISHSLFWASAGAAVDARDNALFAFEGGAYLIINVGLGASVLRSNGTTQTRPHLFLGLPLPVPVPSACRLDGAPISCLFVEPYYRLSVPGFADARATNEYGVLAKVYFANRSIMGSSHFH